MKNKYKGHCFIDVTTLLLIVTMFVNPVLVVAYDDKIVHPAINLHAADQSVLVTDDILLQLGFTRGLDSELQGAHEKLKISKWFEKGGTDEDEGTRALQHFHDPLKSAPWSDAGLDFPILSPFTSSLVWAQDPALINGGSDTNTYSWLVARSKYYEALTANGNNSREELFAYTFRALGQVMHLVSDLAVPAHVRNDPHPKCGFKTGVELALCIMHNPDYYEIWTAEKDNWQSIYFIGDQIGSDIFNQVGPDASAFIPITALWDQDVYSEESGPAVTLNSFVGLAEYTNANFFSRSRIYSGYKYPSKDNTKTKSGLIINNSSLASITINDLDDVIEEDGTPGKRIYAYATDNAGNTTHKIASLGYYGWNDCPSCDGGILYDYTLDDKEIHADYAARLIPRAVGYSTALIDYFFRGSIEIAQPLQGGYALVEDPSQGFTQIIVLAKNTSPEGEDMTNGSIELVIKYRISQGDPFQNVPVDSWPEINYTVVSVSNNINSIPRDNPVELVFDIPTQEAIPINATDVYLQLVYKGTLGNEEGAVAVGFKDISEPTPVDFFNNMDKICLNGTWYDAGSTDAIAIVDGNKNGIADPEYELHEWDVYNHGLRDIYIGFSPISYPLQPTSLNYDVFIQELLTGENKRVFVLADYDFSIGASSDTIIPLDPNDSWGHPPIASVDSFGAVKNQEENGVRQYPVYDSFRGLLMQDGIIYQNPPYPSGSLCDDSLLN